MNHNNRILTKGQAVLLSLILGFMMPISLLRAQSLVSAQSEQDSIRWQANALLNPFLTVLLSNSGSQGTLNPMGLQMKRYKGENAMRWHLEYAPSRAFIWGNSNVANIRDRSGDTLRLINHDYIQHQFRAGMGFERGKQRKLGRRYFGADLSLTYRYTRHWTHEAFYHLEEGRILLEEIFGTPNPSRHLSAFGMGFKPFIGLERPLTEHWGFNLEAKLDVMAQVTQGYTIRDDGQFEALSNYFLLETFPLLEVRLYYKL